MNIEKVKSLAQLINQLTPSEIEILSSKLSPNLNIINGINVGNTTNTLLISIDDVTNCNHCGSIKIHKHNKRNNKQR